MPLVTDEQIDSANYLLDTSLYAVIATVNDDGTPWNTPVFFCRDQQNALYWASALDSRHSQNISLNNRVSIVVFDSAAAWGHGYGVFLNATVSIVEKRGDIDEVRSLRMRKTAAASQPAEEFQGPSPRRLFKAVPTEAWVNADSKVAGVNIDVRISLPLETLTG